MRLTNAAADRWRQRGIRYQVALRCIGQDLTPLLLEQLEITVHDEEFVAKARCIGSAGEVFVRRYTTEDIKLLDQVNAARKSESQSTPDASSLSESLRTIGRIIDSRKMSLIKLTKEKSNVVFVYRDEGGQLQREELQSLLIYKSQQEGVGKRGVKKPEDPWDESEPQGADSNFKLKL